MQRVFIGIGSNLGDTIGNCKIALEEIGNFAEIVRISSLYETEPVGNEDQPNFINCAVEINTDLSPHELLSHLNSVEDKLGRVRGEKWGPRVIDLDIIFYDGLVMKDDDLIIPHPRAHLRRFVLEPICEIARDFIHPELKISILELLEKLGDSKVVIKLEQPFTTAQQ
ncbi:MAG: 2-amino-4-hydroxy-6-hydroxymethyldihydropteridine diphosphokinase [Candidatus Dadabacteria bacterium]|nr:2-amino-4-hydroxy-6-hydroxymethyldihydropteridine diphosphokinase [Candidatus Dadabacteria bacterium]TDI90977.1 MAG: 2-amino-4-hydroxy-6-hydroxymethyldihydropteridine diphosphokinase [Candidatus Dadabacteria bacterium]